jgi:glycosyltransferase involved in cell wall biosynthesis
MPIPATRLAVVISHPIQYYAPWFSLLASQSDIRICVFYLWDFGSKPHIDAGFRERFVWDVPLLDGYDHVFVPNCARDQGTHHFGGLINPLLPQFLLSWRPDAILLFGYAYSSHFRLLLDLRFYGIPFLFRGDSHILVPRTTLRARISVFLRRLLFNRFSAALAVGTANMDWLRDSGLQSNRIVLAPHAVDNDRFLLSIPSAECQARSWRQQLGIPLDSPVVLFAGKFEPKKCPLDLMRAFAALNHQSAFLVFVGGGVLESEMRFLASTLPNKRILFLPFQNQSLMPRVYSLANLVVLPSRGPSETWGLCVNEAMLMARPVVVSSHVGCGPDLVIPNQTGFVFRAGDTDALSLVLSEALHDLNRLRSMGFAAQARVSEFCYSAATDGLRSALMLVRQ